MMKQTVLLAILLAASAASQAAVKCGPFTIVIDSHHHALIDGNKPRQQKITYTGRQGDDDNVNYHWIVKNARAPGMLKMDHLYQSGKATLAVEVVRTSASQIKLSGSYDCHKID